MKRRTTLNLFAAAIVAVGGTFLTAAAPASAYVGATCTVTVKKPDGTIIVTTVEGTTCTRNEDNSCTCT
jgi:hypothetical protein